MYAIEQKNVRVKGCLLKTAQLNDEYYVSIASPTSFMANMWEAGVKADLFTFVQELHDRTPRHPYCCEWDRMAVLPLTTYARWMDKQIKFRTRNKIKKAWKSGVKTRVVQFSDELLHGITEIYNETRIRQGKRNWHFGKDVATLRAEHSTFLERSEFIGAYFQEELIGFAKVTHSENYSIIMNIVGKLAHRDKAPTNALIAKTVDLVTARAIPLLNYGVWGRRGLNDFKVASAFECFEVPRYFIPLTLKGRIALKLRLHPGIKERMPERWISLAADLRARWNERRYGRGGWERVNSAGRSVLPKAKDDALGDC